MDHYYSLALFIFLLVVGTILLLVSFANANRVKGSAASIGAFSALVLSGASYYRAGFGYDYESYLGLFNSLPDCGCYSKGPLFFFVMHLTKSFGLSFDFFLASVTLVFTLLLMAVVKKALSRQTLLPFLIIISLYFFVSIMGQVRQFLAISIAAYSIINIRRSELSILTFFTAVLVHPSILVLLPGYYFYRKSYFPSLYTSLALLIFAFALGYVGFVFNIIHLFFDFPIIGNYAKKVSSYHEYWMASGRSLSLYTVILTQLIFLSGYKYISRDIMSRRLYLLSLFGAILVFLLYQDSHIYGRVVKIFRLFDFLLIFRVLYVGRFSVGFKLWSYYSIVFFTIAFLFKDYLRLESL